MIARRRRGGSRTHGCRSGSRRSSKLRRLRFTAAEIAETLGMALSTVSGILTRIGMGKLGRLGLEQPVRYERSRPGELVHIDVKKLGRIHGGAGKRVGGSRASLPRCAHRSQGKRRGTIGWEYVHVAVDDYSRLAYAEVLPDEKASTAVALPAPSRRLLPPLRHPRRASPHRQRLRLPRRPSTRWPAAARHPPPPHTPLPATDKRQSRALHPHPAQRLGLRRDLRIKQRTHRRP